MRAPRSTRACRTAARRTPLLPGRAGGSGEDRPQRKSRRRREVRSWRTCVRHDAPEHVFVSSAFPASASARGPREQPGREHAAAEPRDRHGVVGRRARSPSSADVDRRTRGARRRRADACSARPRPRAPAARAARSARAGRRARERRHREALVSVHDLGLPGQVAEHEGVRRATRASARASPPSTRDGGARPGPRRRAALHRARRPRRPAARPRRR